MKSLEALENIRREAGFPYFSTLYDIDMWREDFAIVEKHLKALEIIKDKIMRFVSVEENLKDKKFYVTDLDYYRRLELTKEEYDLLKEVLYED